MQKMTSTLISLLIGMILLNIWMYFHQPNMIFFPWKELDETPDNWGLSYQDVTLQTKDNIQLHGWYIPQESSDQVLLFFHGNAGNISHRRNSIEIFHRLGLNVFIIDYRGYGKSEGSPSEQGLYLDATAAWNYLTKDKGFSENQVLIFGRSLGGAVAAQLAADVDARGVILESTLSSAQDFANAVFPVLSRLMLMRYDFNTVEKMQRINYPILVLHSPDDEIMPFPLGEKVFQSANQPKQFVPMRGGHNNGFILSQPEYEQTLNNWLKTLGPTGYID